MDAPLLLLGEAAGYRDARVSGIPFTSERQLTGKGPAEVTATVVDRVLAELGPEESVLLWNVVPTHPGRSGRTDGRLEWISRRDCRFLHELAVGRRAIAVSRVAQRVLGRPQVRPSSHAAAADFRADLATLLHRRTPGPPLLRPR